MRVGDFAQRIGSFGKGLVIRIKMLNMRIAFVKYFLPVVFYPVIVSAQSKKGIAEFANWPANASPLEVGQKVADHFIATPHTNFNRSTPPRIITYPETCTWYGAL